ncbi:hypothetical protein DFH06DRAFT_1124353 [Mycena polygramma]|nr:hypothetical protein DFH06DRAFT_1124353 [Mycena polygramma]
MHPSASPRTPRNSPPLEDRSRKAATGRRTRVVHRRALPAHHPRRLPPRLSPPPRFVASALDRREHVSAILRRKPSLRCFSDSAARTESLLVGDFEAQKCLLKTRCTSQRAHPSPALADLHHAKATADNTSGAFIFLSAKVSHPDVQGFKCTLRSRCFKFPRSRTALSRLHETWADVVLRGSVRCVRRTRRARSSPPVSDVPRDPNLEIHAAVASRAPHARTMRRASVYYSALVVFREARSRRSCRSSETNTSRFLGSFQLERDAGRLTSLTLFRHNTSEHAVVLVCRLRRPAFPGKAGLTLKLERVTRPDGGISISSGDPDPTNLCYDKAADWLTISTRNSSFAPELRSIKRAHRVDKTLTFPAGAGTEAPSLLDVLAAANLVGNKYPRYSLTDHGGLFYALAVYNVLEVKFNGRVKRGPDLNRATVLACMNEYQADFEAVVEEFDNAKAELLRLIDPFNAVPVPRSVSIPPPFRAEATPSLGEINGTRSPLDLTRSPAGLQ